MEPKTPTAIERIIEAEVAFQSLLNELFPMTDTAIAIALDHITSAGALARDFARRPA